MHACLCACKYFFLLSQTKPSPCNLVSSFPEMTVMPLKCSGIIKSSYHRWTNFGGKRRSLCVCLCVCVCVCETRSGPNSYGQPKWAGLSVMLYYFKNCLAAIMTARYPSILLSLTRCCRVKVFLVLFHVF